LLIFLAIDVSTLNLREFRWLIALKKTLGSLKLEMFFGLKPSYALNNAIIHDGLGFSLWVQQEEYPREQHLYKKISQAICSLTYCWIC
jgi:hypothetical protein